MDTSEKNRADHVEDQLDLDAVEALTPKEFQEEELGTTSYSDDIEDQAQVKTQDIKEKNTSKHHKNPIPQDKVYAKDNDQEAGVGSDEEVVFRMRDGRILTREFLEAKKKSKVYEKLGAEKVPAQAFSLHQQAREAGSKGEYEAALAFLEEARKLAPDWPYPIYDAAYTYLLMGDSHNALEK